MKNPSSHAIWKPCSRHPVKSKSEKLMKQNTLRRSEQSSKEAIQSEKTEAHQEAVGVKRKRMTGRSFFTSLLKKIPNNVVDERPAVDRSDDSRTSTVLKEMIDNSESVSTNCSPAKSKEFPEPEITTCLIRSINEAINSECVAETIIPQSAECENSGLLGTCTSCSKEKGICYNSQEKELCTCNNTAQKDLDCSSTRKLVYGSVINEIEKKCDRRMKKLVQKQKREVEEFNQIWEAKKLKLETDHKLSSALVRCIYAEGSARTTNLNLLDGKFAREMEANDLLKDSQLKDVEAKQLNARKEERERAGQWIAEAKAYCSGQQAEDVGVSVGSPNDSIINNQPEFTREIVCVDLPATGEAVLDEMGSVEINYEVQLPSEQAEAYLQVPEDPFPRNYSSELQNQGAQAVGENKKKFNIEFVVSETVDGVTTSKSNSKLPAQDALAPDVEDHGILLTEDTNSAENGTVTPSQNNVVTENCEQQLLHASIDASPSENQSTAIEIESQTHDSPRNSSRTAEAAETEILDEDQSTSESDSLNFPQYKSELSNRDSPVPAVEDHGTLHIENSTLNPLQSNFVIQDIVSPSENRSTVIEVDESHDSGRNPEIEMLPRECPSRTGVNLGMQNNAVISPNPVFFQLGTDLGNRVTCDSPTFFAKPLQIELENICRKTEQLEKIYEETRLRQKSDCEKEMQEMAAQVLKKYELKNQEAEAEYISKKNGLNENHKKVVLNKLLAKAFSFICEDLQPSGLPGVKLDFPSGSMHQQSPQHSVGTPHVAINNFQAYRPAHVNNNRYSSIDIRHALSLQLQAFRPAASSFISQHNLQQRMLATTANQNWPQHQGGPQSPWTTFLRPMYRQYQVSGEPYFTGFN